MGAFMIHQRSNDQFEFILNDDKENIVISSGMYATVNGCAIGIASVKKNSAQSERFEIRKSPAQQDYFVLTAGNGEVIATSILCDSLSELERVMDFVKRNALESEVKMESNLHVV